MADFLIESNMRANRPGLLTSVMVQTKAKYEEDIKTMTDFVDESMSEAKRLFITVTENALVIAERRRNPTDKRDLLNIMLYSKDPKTGEILSDLNIRNNVTYSHHFIRGSLS